MVASLDVVVDCCRQVELGGRLALRHSGQSGNSPRCSNLGRRRGRGLRKARCLRNPEQGCVCGLSPRSPIGGECASERERFPAAAQWMAGVGRELDAGPRREVGVCGRVGGWREPKPSRPAGASSVKTAQLSERDSPGETQSCRAAELLSGMRQQQPTRADGDGLVCRRERERWSRRE